ncbi:MAG: hypothetical protein FE048_03765 [Thermoplasmata archaeon]|nr:MAG: hypothetical protein FE048_03765 [Thermoplasmata archaeon]
MMKNSLSKILICTAIVFSLTITSFPLAKSDDNSKLHMNYYFFSPKIVRGMDYDTIEMDGCQLYTFHGIKLPAKPLHILLPYKSDIDSIEVRGFGKVSMGEGYNIQKTKSILHLSPWGNGNCKSSAEGKIPEEMYNLVGVYGWRGYKIAVLNLHPVHYDLQTGEIVYYKQMELIINLKEGKSSELFRGLKRDREIVSKIIDNVDALKSYPVKKATSSIEYVIITSDEFKSMEGEYSFQGLIDFKKSMGINATIVSVEEIISNPLYWDKEEMFNDTQAKIRNFIRDAYLNWGTDYILLGGDGDIDNPEENIIPPRYLFATTGGLPLGYDEEGYIPSDIYYACLDGTFNPDMDDKWGENASSNNISDVDEADLYAEVWVGRACVDSSQEVSNFVMKTISYASSQNDSFFRKILMVGEYIGFGGIADFGSNYKDEIKSLIPDEYEKLTLYDRDWPGFDPNDPWGTGWEKEDIMALLNEGVHVVNHDGHSYYGYNMRMRNGDVDTLTNTQYYFVYSQGCMAGGFDNPNGYDCIAEHHTVETPHGAFAVIMNSRYGLGMEESTDAPSQRYDISFFKAIFSEGIRELGRANHYSKEENAWRIDEPGMRWACYETNLLGDPQLSLKKPEITVSIEKPDNGFYLFDRGPFLSFPKPVIIGGITIIASSSGDIDGISFYVDGVLMHTVYEEPYEWKWDSLAIGYHTITVEAFTDERSVEQKKEVFIFNL